MNAYIYQADIYCEDCGRALCRTVPFPAVRVAASLHRIAELQCSSEAADRDRVPCPGDRQGRDDWCLCRDYGSGGHDEVSGKVIHAPVPRVNVREAQIERRVRALCTTHGLTPIFSGDPRGAVLKLKVPSGRTNDGGREGVCVP